MLILFASEILEVNYMLIKCPECELQVSDKAAFCPHCGYPMKPVKRPYAPKKRQRLPNGFGEITEIKNRNLRKPFRAMVTVGKDPSGRLIRKTLKPNAYFSTYNEAYAALVEYNRNPYDLDSEITCKELYDRWLKEYSKTVGTSAYSTMRSAWKYCWSVYDTPVKELRARHIKGCIEDSYVERNGNIIPAGESTKTYIKTLFNMMLDYAVEYELVEKNYARTFKPQHELNKKESIHMPFTDEEMAILWKHADDETIRLILINCYTGWRPGELLEMSVDLDNQTMTSGSKTEAGKDRTVPIHPNIIELVRLFELKRPKYGYQMYRKKFIAALKKFGLDPNHRPHDPRVHFVTQAKKYNVDEYAIKYIVGHAIKDITERVYTRRDIDWLRSEIKKIK